MTIDVSVHNSPGWWMQKGSKKLEQRLPTLRLLARYHDGEPPLPTANETSREAFTRFQRQSCTNFAELIVGSVRERVSVRDIRTAASGDQVDDVAWRIWRNNGLDVEFSDVLENMLALGDAYMIVGLDASGEVQVTGEDPRQVVTFHNPARQSEVRAAVKMFHDPDLLTDYIYLFLPGGGSQNARRYVASRPSASLNVNMYPFAPQGFNWDPAFGGPDGEELNHPLVPVVRFRNRRGVGEYEPHLALLDRINHGIYNRMVIGLYQAFKQRAIKVDVTDAVDENGKPVDAIPDDLLTSDPGSWIQLPKDSEIWESQQADMQGILSAVDADVKQLAAVTRRPMAIFAPDNQSAEGASFTREGLTFATEDKQTRSEQALADVFNIAFLCLEDAVRADKSKIIVGWKPAERYSITDKASASAQASTVLAKRTIMREVFQFTPPEIDQAEAEASDEALLAQEFAPPAPVVPVNANAA